jgi:hypothetical protein
MCGLMRNDKVPIIIIIIIIISENSLFFISALLINIVLLDALQLLMLFVVIRDVSEIKNRFSKSCFIIVLHNY